jgi:hypothetical protein
MVEMVKFVRVLGSNSRGLLDPEHGENAKVG